MATNYVQPGDVLTLTAPADLTSGQPVQVGLIVGIATAAALETEAVEVATRGVYDVPKTSAQAWTVGALVYWDDTNGEFTTTAAEDNVLAGVAVAVAANPSATGRVRLNGSFTTAVPAP